MESITSRDGTSIAFERTGDGPPLVLVHGTASDHTRWAPVQPAFEKHFSVIAMDRRGRGGSGDRSDYVLEREFEDVAAVVDAQGGPVVLLGHSFGALCSLEAALLSDNVSKLVLYEPPIPWEIIGPHLFSESDVVKMETLLSDGKNEEAALFFMREVVKLPPEQLEVLQAAASWPGRVAAAATIPREERAPAGYGWDPERYQGLAMPVLLLSGGASPLGWAQATRALHEAIPGSRLELLEGQGHVGDYSAPEMFVEKVMGFVGSR